MIAAKADCLAGKVTRYAFAFILGWLACSWWYGTLGLTRAARTLPVVQKEETCEHIRAQIATKLALQPTIVAPGEIPKDCSHPKS